MPSQTTSNAFLHSKRDPSGLLREAEAARRIGVSVRTLQAWRQRGGGPRYVKISSRAIRYRPSDLDLWIEDRICKSTAEG